MQDRRTHLLIVDDEPSVRKVLRRYFEKESYTVSEAQNRDEAVAVLDNRPIDLITIDVNLDGEDGLKLVREIRSNSAIPIILVSGKGELVDKVVGLEMGADDYISKPFELREVLARVKSALRRPQLNTDSTQSGSEKNGNQISEPIRFANCILCPNTRDLVRSDGTACMLTTSEFNLLHALASHSRQVLTRDQIMDAMKGAHWNPTDRTIDNQIARLRKKMQAQGIEHGIKTVRGMGYQFTYPV